MSISKNKSNYDENWACYMYLNVWVWDKFWAARNGEKAKFYTLQAHPALVRVISFIFCMQK